MGSSSSIFMMQYLIDNGLVDDFNAEMFLSKLAFIGNPDVSMLLEAAPLLSMTGTLRKTIHLGVSSLAYNYCKTNAGCESNEVVKTIIR